MQPIGEPEVGTLFGDEEVDALRDLLRSGRTLSRGPEVAAFETEFAAYCGTTCAVATSSCTTALRLAVQLARIGAGDEVIVPANSFWNSVVALVEKRASIKVADVDPDTLQMDPASLERLIGPKTKMVLILSFGGSPCDMDRIRDICDRFGTLLVEDAAHSVGATYKGRKVGGLSDITCFSFSSLKNMSTLGEGGMVTTANPDFAAEAVKLRDCWPIGRRTPRATTDFGEFKKPKDSHFMRPGDSFDYDWSALEVVGANLRMSAAEAVVGRIQLRRLEQHNQMRRDRAALYDRALAGLPGLSPIRATAGSVANGHLYNFRIDEATGIDRNDFVQRLKDDFAITMTNRFWPIHLHSVLRMDGHKLGEAPVFERIWFKQLVALPIAPTLTDEQTLRIVDALQTLYGQMAASQPRTSRAARD